MTPVSPVTHCNIVSRHKAAIAGLVDALQEANASALWSSCPSVSSRAALYALMDSRDPSSPTDAQLQEFIAYGRRHISKVAALLDALADTSVPPTSANNAYPAARGRPDTRVPLTSADIARPNAHAMRKDNRDGICYSPDETRERPGQVHEDYSV